MSAIGEEEETFYSYCFPGILRRTQGGDEVGWLVEHVLSVLHINWR